MKKIVWLLRLGIVAFGALLVFESIEAPKHAPAPSVYVVNPAVENKPAQRSSNGQVRLPHEVLHAPQTVPVAAPQSLAS